MSQSMGEFHGPVGLSYDADGNIRKYSNNDNGGAILLDKSKLKKPLEIRFVHLSMLSFHLIYPEDWFTVIIGESPSGMNAMIFKEGCYDFIHLVAVISEPTYVGSEEINQSWERILPKVADAINGYCSDSPDNLKLDEAFGPYLMRRIEESKLPQQRQSYTNDKSSKEMK